MNENKPDDEFGFLPYRPGRGRLADRALERVKGNDEWTKKHARAAKLLKIKNRIKHLWQKLSDRLRYLYFRVKRALRRSTKPSEG